MIYLYAIGASHWLVVFVTSVLIEIIGGTGSTLAFGIAALIQAIICWLFPELTWQYQFMIFGGLSFVFSLVYWRYFKIFYRKTENWLINYKPTFLIGKLIRLNHDLPNGAGEVEIDDKLWKVKCAHSLKVGDFIRVVGASSVVLIVERDY